MLESQRKSEEEFQIKILKNMTSNYNMWAGSYTGKQNWYKGHY